MISKNSVVTQSHPQRSALAAAERIEDKELLRRFRHGSHEEANQAFAQIVRRHQAVVLGVCRRVLHDEHEAEDAFQATFLLLARKAKHLRDTNSLAAWLHRVAFRICLRVRDRRQKHPHLLDDCESLSQAERTLQQESAREACLAIDEELERLPDEQRLFLILCALEGLSYHQVAQRLGVTHNQVKWGLSRARSTLRLRLARRGLAYSGCMLAALATHKSAVAAPAALSISTAELATQFVYYPATLTVASKPILLAYEGLHVMLLTKLKTAVLITVALSTLGIGSFVTIASAANSRSMAREAAIFAQDDDREQDEARAQEKRARAEAEKQRAIAEEQRRRAEEQLRVAEQVMQQRKQAQEEALRAQLEARAVQDQMRKELENQRRMMEQRLQQSKVEMQNMREMLEVTEQKAEAMRRRAEELERQAIEARDRNDEVDRRRQEEQLAKADEAQAQARVGVAKLRDEMQQLERRVAEMMRDREQVMEQLERTELDRERAGDLMRRRREEEKVQALEALERTRELSLESHNQMHEIVARFEDITNEQRARTEELSHQVQEIRNIQEKILIELRRLRESRMERSDVERRENETSAADVKRDEQVRRQRQQEMEVRAMAEFKEAQARLEKMRAEEVLRSTGNQQQLDLQKHQIAELKAMIGKLQGADDSDANRAQIAALKKVIQDLQQRSGNASDQADRDDVKVQMKRKMEVMADQLKKLEAEKAKIEVQLKQVAEMMKQQAGDFRKQ